MRDARVATTRDATDSTTQPRNSSQEGAFVRQETHLPAATLFTPRQAFFPTGGF